MAVEQSKVITALTAKLAGKNVSQKLKESYATRWANKIETDDDIDSFVDDRWDDVWDAQKEADRRAASSTKEARQQAAKAAAGEDTDEANTANDTKAAAVPNIPEGMEWMKAFLEGQQKQMETLTQTVTGMQQARSAETTGEKFRKDERLKDVSPAIVALLSPKDDAGYEDAVTKAVETSKAAQQHYQGTAGTGSGTPGFPPQPAGKAGEVKQISANEAAKEAEMWK